MKKEFCDPKAILEQLNRTEGQILALKKMHSSGRRCDELLQQVIAARASLSKFGTMLLEAEAKGCLGNTNSPQMRDLERTVSQLFKIT